MNELLVVYNTCGINGKDIDRYDYYTECIDSILNQDHNLDIKLCISSCLNTDRVVGLLQDRYFDAADILWIKEAIPVNVTFNKAVQECVKKYGEFNGYLYIDSGIKLTNDKTIQEMYNAYLNNNAAMICVVPDSDSGFEYWNLHPEQSDSILKIPVGLATNLHCQIFTNDLFKTFDNRLMPDLFGSYGTESVFSTMCSSIMKDWIILTKILVQHSRGYDGPSACRNTGRHDDIYLLNKTVQDIFYTDEANELNPLYETYRGITKVDPTKYDENGHSIHPERLQKWILDNLFLDKSILNYENIKGEFLHKK